MKLVHSLEQFGLDRAIDMAYKDPDKNLMKIMDWADKFAGDDFVGARRAIRKELEDKNSPYQKYITHIINDINPDVAKTLLGNFFLNACLAGWKREDELRNKLDCNIPWAILMDPTSACNLHCTGCWAAEYGNKLNLSLEELDDIMCQGKNMGVYFYLLTGGEPMVRKEDIIKLCEKHDDCVILAFTNGTLIDDEFAEEMLRVKNFIPCISIEGFGEATDSRRGVGVYDKVMHACDVLRRNRLPFGFSCCYTSANFESITSKEFLDSLKDVGAFFTWFFHYMPVGNNASTDLLLSPEQRKYMYHKIREIRGIEGGKELFAIDFQNDGEFVHGCVAGGERNCHINANGDVEPCVFIHYSGANIKEKSLLECLKQPLFMAYKEGQPFNDNFLKPCPMLENPEILQQLVNKTGAKSTDLEAPESCEHLCGKCTEYAKAWAPVADELWAAGHTPAADKPRKV